MSKRCEKCGRVHAVYACECSAPAPQAGHILFVVMGSEDIYSSHAEWTVAAYTDKHLAEQHAKKALEWHEANRKKCDEDWSLIPEAEPNPYDTYSNSMRDDREYGVYPLFVHFDPEQYRAEVQVLTDKARELGYLP